MLTWENYIPDTDIYASVYDHEGTPLVDPFDVSDSALTSEFYPWVAALPDDAYALTWQQRSSISTVSPITISIPRFTTRLAKRFRTGQRLCVRRL